MIRRPTRCTRTVTLFPSTTLCRARQAQFLALIEKGVAAQREQQHQRQPRQALRIAPLRPARDMARGIMVGKRTAWPAFALVVRPGRQRLAHRRGVERGGIEQREIGRASCRERVCKYVLDSVVAVYLKKKKKHSIT